MSTIVIAPNGDMTFIYNDDLRPLMEQGDAVITRASHVEPTPGGEWTADMGPVNGPTLGPFTTRSEALSTEVAWLEENHLRGNRSAN